MSGDESNGITKTFVTVLSVIILPIVVSLVTNFATRDLKNREIEAHFVELAISILNTAPRSDKTDVALRDWAAKIVDSFSGVPLSAEARKAVVEAPLPSSPVVSRAEDFERQAFQALLQGDVATARNRFSEADRIYPGYHSAFEATKVLKSQPDQISDPSAKKELLKAVKKEYWHIPPDIAEQLNKQTQ